MARTGKIARLPLAIREQLNHRLLEGETAAKILPWLNQLPEVQAVLQEDFEGLHVSDQNLSEWRRGGYAEWTDRRDKIAHTRELSAYAAKLAQANGSSIAEGGAAIASGVLMQLLETCGEISGEDPPARKAAMENFGELINGLTALRTVEVQAGRLDVAKERLKQIDQTLDLERAKFQRTTCELFLKWREDTRASAIAEGPGNHDEKIEALGQAMFGDLWSQVAVR